MSTNLQQKQTKPCTHLKIVHKRNDSAESDYIESELQYCAKLEEKVRQGSFDLHVSCLNTINEYVRKILKTDNSKAANDIIQILDDNIHMVNHVGKILGYESIFNESFIKINKEVCHG